MFPRIVFFFFLVISITFGLETDGVGGLPSETECRPYIEKALQREAGAQESLSEPIQETQDDVGEQFQQGSAEAEAPDIPEDPSTLTEVGGSEETTVESQERASVEVNGEDSVGASVEVFAEATDVDGGEVIGSAEVEVTSTEVVDETVERTNESEERTEEVESVETVVETPASSAEVGKESEEAQTPESKEDAGNVTEIESAEQEESKENQTVERDKEETSIEKQETENKSEELSEKTESVSNQTEDENSTIGLDTASEESQETTSEQNIEVAKSPETPASDDESKETISEPDGSAKAQESTEQASIEETKHESEEKVIEETPEEELTMGVEIPKNLRSREHMVQILRLETETEAKENLLSKTIDATLKELKKLYETAIKPLEILYKYRDLSNRHFGDPEIFSKPLILFMGPWSGGKSTIINYLLENEYKKTALRTGAEPSPAYFNIVMWGEKEEVLDGTQLAADWTYSGLQKFGQGLLDRLRGLKLNHPLLQKVNIVEIPGILEIRKQVERLFPFNDACQWFIDRADIIFLVYDPSKLDVGPETEAILDQLKGREMQTKIILNKADQVRPEELMRVQGTLIWNISPLMSSTEPPVMYSTSLWSLPYEAGAPTRLLQAQEAAFLKDLRDAIDKRVENKIASARRFAVRVRNHAKMVDCYLTTYYNHKTFFGNKKKISDDIIEHPQNYHIYEGLSTLTNISRYDLPDPDVYRDFFRLNPVYEFQQLSATCTYFKGCPINRLDVAIAYDLPELIGKYKNSVDDVLNPDTSSEK